MSAKLGTRRQDSAAVGRPVSEMSQRHVGIDLRSTPRGQIARHTRGGEKRHQGDDDCNRIHGRDRILEPRLHAHTRASREAKADDDALGHRARAVPEHEADQLPAVGTECGAKAELARAEPPNRRTLRGV